MTASSTSPQITSLDFLPLDECVDRPHNKCVTFKLDATDEDGQYDEDHSIARTHATFQLDYYDDDGRYEIASVAKAQGRAKQLEDSRPREDGPFCAVARLS